MKTKEEIMEQFEGFTDGIRMIMLTQRNKEGGKSKNPDRVAKRKITTNQEEFEKVLSEFLEIKKASKKPLRIYSSVNRRDFNKGIREFKRQQLEADYDERNRNNFYLNIKNKFLGSLMKPSSREETQFLIDIDEKDEIILRRIERILTEIIRAEILLEYQTKSGWHIITEPFNPSLFDTKYGEIKKDGLLLLDY